MTNNMTQDAPAPESKTQSAGADTTQKRTPVTLKDVAKRANVSPTTASLFFNGREDVCAKSTAVRLRQAAAELQYPTNRGRRRNGGNRILGEHSAGGGAHSRTARIGTHYAPDFTPESRVDGTATSYVFGVCIPHNANPNASPAENSSPINSDASLEGLWRGISHVADVEDCQILQYPRRAREGASIEPFLNESRADGMIMLAAPNDSRPAALAAAGIPVVLVGRASDIPEACAAVFTLESDTVDLALSHLWQLGHRRIAYLSGPGLTDIGIGDGGANRRLDRYSAWTKIRGVFDADLIFSGRFRDGGMDASGAIARMFALPNCPTAVFCESDAAAAAACGAAITLGVSVPGELSILGVGNSSIASENQPSLSSVEIPFEEIGVQAVVQLTRLLEGASPSVCRTAVPVTNLVARESTGPLQPSPRFTKS